MTIQPAVKDDLTGVKSADSPSAASSGPSGSQLIADSYNDALHERFMLWKDQSGASVNRVAGMIGRSAALVSQYVNKIYKGDMPALEKDIANLLRREEDLEFTTQQVAFCNILSSKLIWEVMQFCDKNCDMGMVVGDAGSGKTTTCNEYKRANRNTIFVTADIATRSVGSVLRMIAKKVSGTPHPGSNSALLHAIIDRLKHSRRLIIIDEAHFLTWDAFEVIRKIHDCAEVGIVYVGMPRTLDQMKGTAGRSFLFDQIYSRISIKRDHLPVEKSDIRIIADNIRPGLGADCIEYLYKKAQGKGKIRTVAKLLQVAITRHREYSQPMDLDLLKEADQFLLRS
jgi:DNA transposition AAA+ family ATPase